MTTIGQQDNFNNSLPAPDPGYINVLWKADSPLTSPRNISAAFQNAGGVEYRTTTAESILDSDVGQLIDFSNGSAIAVTLGTTGAILSAIVYSAGSGYSVSDTFTIAGGTGGTGHVASVSGGGVVSIVIDSQGHGYTSGATVNTTATSGGGSGLQLSLGVVTSAVRSTFVCAFMNSGAGTATLTPQSGTINGAANLAVTTGQSGWLFFDGTNWLAVLGAGGGGSGTVTHTSGALTLDQPVFGNGGGDIKVGTKSGNTDEVATVSGSLTSGNLVKSDASGNIVDAAIAASAVATQSGVQNESYIFGTDTGAANAYVLTLSPAVASYAAGQGFIFKAANPNSGSSTLNVNGLGTKTIQKYSAGALTNLASGDIVAGQIVVVRYDGTVFQMDSPSATPSSPPSGSAGGDLTGTYPNPGVGKVNGAVIPLSAAALASNASRQLVAATLSGNTATIATVSGSTTGGDVAVFDGNGNVVDGGAPPGGSGQGFAYGGDGSDGVINFDGTSTYAGIETHTGSAPNLVYTLARDVFATTLTVASGKTCRTAQCKIFATVSVTVNGTLSNDGTAASGINGGSDGTTGANAGGSLPFPLNSLVGRNGTAGGAGGTTTGTQAAAPGGGITAANAIATAQYNPTTWSSGKGGAVGGNLGGAARAYGGPGTNTTTKHQPRWPSVAIPCYDPTGTQIYTTNSLGGGAGGGGGAGDNTNAGAAGGAGGGTGGSGGFLVICSPLVSVGGSGIISASGGAGGNGVNGSNAATTGTGRGGGGGGAGGPGGNAGAIIIVFHVLSNGGTIQANAGAGGTHGSGGTGFGTGAAGDPGQDGQNGAPGFIIEIKC